jgi:hypothetical protein
MVKMNLVTKAIFVSALFVAAAGAHATKVYRCGPQGNVYSQEPCPGGRAIDVSDERSPEQSARPREQMKRDAAMAAELRSDRVTQEIALANATAAAARHFAALDRAAAERERAEEADRRGPTIVIGGGFRGVRRGPPVDFAAPYRSGQLVHPNTVQFGNAPAQIGLNASLRTQPMASGGVGAFLDGR